MTGSGGIIIETFLTLFHTSFKVEYIKSSLAQQLLPLGINQLEESYRS